jgi:hypothetical protein
MVFTPTNAGDAVIALFISMKTILALAALQIVLFVTVAYYALPASVGRFAFSGSRHTKMWTDVLSISLINCVLCFANIILVGGLWMQQNLA